MSSVTVQPSINRITGNAQPMVVDAAGSILVDFAGTTVDRRAGNDVGSLTTTQGIQEAHNALPTGGGRVFMAEGTYIISSPIIVRNNMIMEGAGKNSSIGVLSTRGPTIIKADRSFTGTMIQFPTTSQNSGITIRDFALDGSDSATIGIDIENAAHCVIDVIIEDINGDPIDVIANSNLIQPPYSFATSWNDISVKAKSCTGQVKFQGTKRAIDSGRFSGKCYVAPVTHNKCSFTLYDVYDGFNFVEWADTNRFYNLHVNCNDAHAKGIQFNTGSNDTDLGVYGNYIYGCGVELINSDQPCFLINYGGATGGPGNSNGICAYIFGLFLVPGHGGVYSFPNGQGNIISYGNQFSPYGNVLEMYEGTAPGTHETLLVNSNGSIWTSGYFDVGPAGNSGKKNVVMNASTIQFPTGVTSGTGSASLGTNCPASTKNNPYSWLKVTAPDGSTVYVPCWK